jgi:hypothetical protein
MIISRSGWSIGLPLLVAAAIAGGIAFTWYLTVKAEADANAALTRGAP